MRATDVIRIFAGFCLAALLATETIEGQEPNDVLQYRIMTDRNTYVAGEDIFFRIFNLSSAIFRDAGWSSVYYLELISPRGESLVRMKLPLDARGSSGVIHVPGEIPSGTYYLKGYTRWLRNLGPETYSYLSVEVINPVIKTVLPVDTTSSFTVPLLKRNRESAAHGSGMQQGRLRFERRSEVILVLSEFSKDSLEEGCLTVTRPEAVGQQWEYAIPHTIPKNWTMDYLPEIRGVSLTGQVRFADPDAPAPYAVIYVTALDQERSFYCNYCDSLGRFYLAMEDEAGENDLFISASHPETDNLEVLIDQDFCQEPVRLPSFPISADTARKPLIEELCINAQISLQYQIKRTEDNGVEGKSEKFFYGTPGSTIRFADFIRLPTLEEYFEEVIPQVSLRKSDGERKFRVLGSDPELQFYDPLLMVDGVAVFDDAAVLAISPRYIERVELVTAPYIRGNVTFGGIINLITLQGNMGYMDLPSSGLLVEYAMYNKPGERPAFVAPSDPRIPDVRNTLDWQPFTESGQESLRVDRFETSDGRGNYLIWIRGYNVMGEYSEMAFPLEVN